MESGEHNPIEDEGVFGGNGEGLTSSSEENEKICPVCRRPAKNSRGSVCDRTDCAYMGTELESASPTEKETLDLSQMSQGRTTIEFDPDMMEPLRSPEVARYDFEIDEGFLEKIGTNLEQFRKMSPGNQDRVLEQQNEQQAS